MNSKLKFVLVLAFGIAVSAGLSKSFDYLHFKEWKDVNINDCYIRTWSEKDPFKADVVDTLLVLDIKRNYIKYRYNSGSVFTGKLNYFKQDAIKTDSCDCL